MIQVAKGVVLSTAGSFYYETGIGTTVCKVAEVVLWGWFDR